MASTRFFMDRVRRNNSFSQDGNPKPRMFRSDRHCALVNRMGFNNPGAAEVRDRLIERRASGMWPKTPVAANIGRSKKTPNESAASDYSQTLEMLWNHAIYSSSIFHHQTLPGSEN